MHSAIDVARVIVKTALGTRLAESYLPFLYSPGLQETQAVPLMFRPGHGTQFILLPSDNALWKPLAHLHARPAGPFLIVVLISSERSGHE